jgi:hypothetical protein
MFGAVSRTDGALERGIDEVEGWYERITGDGGLRDSCNGKPGSWSFLEGENRVVNRDLIVFF